MHWSQQKAYTTIAKRGHAQLDTALFDAIHQDQERTAKTPSFSRCPQSSASLLDALTPPPTGADAKRATKPTKPPPTNARACTQASAGSYCADECCSTSRCVGVALSLPT